MVSSFNLSSPTPKLLHHHHEQEAVIKNNKRDFFDDLPPGCRFSPHDHELVKYYLTKKLCGQDLPTNRIHDVRLYKYNPEDLAEKYRGFEDGWYFFTPRRKKYLHGARPSRGASGGYWKATGADKPVMGEDGQQIGTRKALVFYTGKASAGVKTNWIMHEFRPYDPPQYDQTDVTKFESDDEDDNDKDKAMGLDNWVLCRIYKKAGKSQRNNQAALAAEDNEHSSFDANHAAGQSNDDDPIEHKPIKHTNNNGVLPAVLSFDSTEAGYGGLDDDGLQFPLSNYNPNPLPCVPRQKAEYLSYNQAATYDPRFDGLPDEYMQDLDTERQQHYQSNLSHHANIDPSGCYYYQNQLPPGNHNEYQSYNPPLNGFCNGNIDSSYPTNQQMYIPANQIHHQQSNNGEPTSVVFNNATQFSNSRYSGGMMNLASPATPTVIKPATPANIE